MYRKWGERLTWEGGVSYWAETFEQDNRIFCFSLCSLFSSLSLFVVEQLESFQKTLGCTWVFSSVWNHALHFRRPCRSAGKDAWHFSPLSSEGRQERSEILSLTSTFLAQAKNTAFSSFAPVGSTYLKFHPDVQRLFCLFVIGVFSDFLCFLFLLLFFYS